MIQRIDFLKLGLARVVCCLAVFLASCVVAPPGKSPSPSAEARSEARSGTSAAPERVPEKIELPKVELAKVDLPESPPIETVDLTSAPDDLLVRIRQGFAMPDLNDDLVQSHQEWYLNRPDYLRRMAERSRLYLYHIVDELDKRGMPMELALLPMVESAYNPMAYSRARASGLWQFIPSTGRHYKLDQDWWKDERRDVIASTAAALEYLQLIYELHGDWHLALASYNWGEGAVGRAIEKNQARGLPADYRSLDMPGQTRNYVPKLQALKNIFRDPDLTAQLDLPPLPNRPYFTTYATDSHIDVSVAAKLAEMPVDEFKALNPAHNRPVIKSDTPLVIPAEKLKTFVDNLEAHGNENKPLSSWQSYTLRPGDRFEKVAQRFGMTVARLKAVNGIRSKARPAPGMTLLVLRGGKDTAGEVAALSGSGQAKTPGASAPATKARRAPVKGPASAAAAGKPAGQSAPKITRYTVRRGDTIYSIARQFKVAAQDLMRRNRVNPRKLKAGTTLTIPAENS
jgi:membrane-bound lytic murein transglycosylase D